MRVDGDGDIGMDSYGVFSGTDVLTQVALERMLAGVATRRHGLVSEPIGEDFEARSSSVPKSAVSRRFKAATEAKLAELLGRDLSGLDVAAMMIDGIVFAQCCVGVALAITADGSNVPVGLWEGDSENTTVVTDLLADLVARGLSCQAGVLFVLDGSKALAAGVKRVFGDRALIQRCVLHYPESRIMPTSTRRALWDGQFALKFSAYRAALLIRYGQTVACRAVRLRVGRCLSVLRPGG